MTGIEPSVALDNTTTQEDDMEWKERYEIIKPQAGFCATIVPADEDKIVAAVIVAGRPISWPQYEDFGFQDIPTFKVCRTFDRYDLLAAKAWVEGILRGTLQAVQAIRSNFKGAFGPEMLEAIGDELENKGVK